MGPRCPAVKSSSICRRHVPVRAAIVLERQPLDDPLRDARAVRRSRRSARRNFDRRARAPRALLDRRHPRRRAQTRRPGRAAFPTHRRFLRKCAGTFRCESALRECGRRTPRRAWGLRAVRSRPHARTRVLRPTLSRDGFRRRRRRPLAAQSWRCVRGTGYSEGRLRSPAGGLLRTRASDPTPRAAPVPESTLRPCARNLCRRIEAVAQTARSAPSILYSIAGLASSSRAWKASTPRVAHEAVGILAGGQHHDAHRGTGVLYALRRRIDGFGCSIAPGSVAVEAKKDVIGVLAQLPGLVFRKRGTERRHGILEAGLVQGDAVEVALDHDERPRALRRAAGDVRARRDGAPWCRPASSTC